eukprot:TRINITY_DN1487_c0_g1_i1.p1 TRINITY_DN1487_c0_g1~~TRINITY_DN1487_c0_g1_i1.p1  ORF type:complete len:221 (-),score=55.48 TRINITY_DN1487_c0_g1_i1:141-803(-)
MAMNLFVKTLSEGTLSFQVESTETVYDLKERIEAEEGIDADFQRLVYAGHNLEDEQTLAALGLEENATVFLSMDLCGGKKKKKKAFTTKKKGHHKHLNVKLAVLKFYTIDGSGLSPEPENLAPTAVSVSSWLDIGTDLPAVSAPRPSSSKNPKSKSLAPRRRKKRLSLKKKPRVARRMPRRRARSKFSDRIIIKIMPQWQNLECLSNFVDAAFVRTVVCI